MNTFDEGLLAMIMIILTLSMLNVSMIILTVLSLYQRENRQKTTKVILQEIDEAPMRV